jgi:glycosyltransferase involved in cell wall biosynthesis
MLVKGSIKHDARVQRSASSLQEAGYEVLVLGSARKSSPREPGWKRTGGIELQVVPLPESPLPRRQRRAAHRVTHLEARCDRIRQRLHELRGRAASEQHMSLRDRLLYRSLKRLLRRAKDRVKREREREKELTATAKAARALDDPHNLAHYEAAWWPLVRKLQPEVVHVHDVSGLSTARRAARHGARWIYEAHESKQHYGERGGEAARRRQVVEHASHADGVIATNALHAEILVRELGLSRMPALVHNTPPLQSRPAPRPGLREAAGVHGDDPLLVYAGVLTRHRRVDVVVEALAMLPDVTLALAVSADDPFTRKLLDLAEELAVSERVRLVPKVPPESVVPFVAEADVGVNPLARYPGGDLALPNKLFEYLHAGLPMVVSDSPAIADFVRRYGLGEVAPVNDARAWAQAIERVLAAPPYRDRDSEWQRLKEQWSWERQAETLLGVYRELLGEPLPEADDRAAPPRDVLPRRS